MKASFPKGGCHRPPYAGSRGFKRLCTIIAYYHIASFGITASSHGFMEKIVANSRVQPGFRITLTKEIRRKLKAKVGDIIVYLEDERGNVIIKKAELKAA